MKDKNKSVNEILNVTDYRRSIPCQIIRNKDKTEILKSSEHINEMGMGHTAVSLISYVTYRKPFRNPISVSNAHVY